MVGARIFVALAFCVLGASFVASTAILISEFRDAEWRSMLVVHSHLFFFFPVFGLLALAAFYRPAVVFTHLYWTNLRHGKLRYSLGLLAVAGLTIAVTQWLDAKPRGLYEVAANVLLADRGEPSGCAGQRSACRRAPLLDTLVSVTEAAQRRVGLSKFARNCQPDALLEIPEEMQKERYCFPAKGKLTGTQCCEAQTRFADTVARMQADLAQRSLTGALDGILFLPLKIFFVLIVVAIAICLAIWRDAMDVHYLELVPAVERGVIIGALAMLFWPLMDYGYQQTSNALYGRWGAGPQFRLSLVIVPWALLLLFYFLRRLRKNLEIVGQLAGVVASAIAILRYEEINDWSVRLFGAGADNATIGILLGIAALGFVQLWWPFRMPVSLGGEPQAAKAPAAAGSAPRAQPGAGAAAKPAGAPTGTGPAASAAAAGLAVAARAAGAGAASSPSTQVRPAATATRPAAAATANPNSTAVLPAAPAKHGPDR
jgi:hypothetical protein